MRKDPFSFLAAVDDNQTEIISCFRRCFPALLNGPSAPSCEKNNLKTLENKTKKKPSPSLVFVNPSRDSLENVCEYFILLEPFFSETETFFWRWQDESAIVKEVKTRRASLKPTAPPPEKDIKEVLGDEKHNIDVVKEVWLCMIKIPFELFFKNNNSRKRSQA